MGLGSQASESSTREPEERSDISIDTERHRFTFEEQFKILGCAMNRQGKTHDAIEERMQSANKAYWKDVMIYKSKDVPWKIKCRRLGNHVYAVLSFGSENRTWTENFLERSRDGRQRQRNVCFRHIKSFCVICAELCLTSPIVS